MKKYSIRCPYCGSEVERWEWWLKFRLIFKDTYYYYCPVCRKGSAWLFIFHLRHDSVDQEEIAYNRKKHWDSRIK